MEQVCLGFSSFTGIFCCFLCCLLYLACFAGKTTTIKLLTGEEALDEGEAWIHGHLVPSSIIAPDQNSASSFQPIYEQMGLCLQSDGLIANLSVREHLLLFARFVCSFHSHSFLSSLQFLSFSCLLSTAWLFFCRIKGVAPDQEDAMVNAALEMIGLIAHQNKWVSQLSGGMKRRLAV